MNSSRESKVSGNWKENLQMKSIHVSAMNWCLPSFSLLFDDDYIIYVRSGVGCWVSVRRDNGNFTFPLWYRFCRLSGWRVIEQNPCFCCQELLLAILITFHLIRVGSSRLLILKLIHGHRMCSEFVRLITSTSDALSAIPPSVSRVHKLNCGLFLLN